MRGKGWTIVELHHASRLWKRGDTLKDIALAMNKTRESIKHQSASRRDLFPWRKQPRHDLTGKTVEVKLKLTVYTYSLIKEEAKERGISINMLVRETFRDRFVRKLWKPRESTSTEKAKRLPF